MNAVAGTLMDRRWRVGAVLILGLEAAGLTAWAASTITPGASVAGFGMRIEGIAWVKDHMEHSDRFPMPPSMMPDMPAHGHARLSIEITIYNEGGGRQLFQAAELQLRSSAGRNWLPSSTTVESMVLSTGQFAHLFLNFDVPAIREEKLQLIWHRRGTERAMIAVPPPGDFHGHHASGHPD
ncbi:MAG: hypothetical protein ACREYE_01580 [Gammaproteobacteria bacterium]